MLADTHPICQQQKRLCESVSSGMLRGPQRETSEVTIIFKRLYHYLVIEFVSWNSVLFRLNDRGD